MSQLRTRTLILLAVLSSFCFPLSPLIASHVGNFADQLLAAKWAESADPATVWSFMATGEYVYSITLLLIVTVALILGVLVSVTLYKRYKKTI